MEASKSASFISFNGVSFFCSKGLYQQCHWGGVGVHTCMCVDLHRIGVYFVGGVELNLTTERIRNELRGIQSRFTAPSHG